MNEQLIYEFAQSYDNQFSAAAKLLIAGYEVLNGATTSDEDYEVFLNYFFEIGAVIRERKTH